MLDAISAIAPYIVALVGLIGGVCASIHANQNTLTAAYFTEKAKAYGTYLDCVSEFTFHPNDSTRTALASALYQVGLFASADVLSLSQDVYTAVIDRSCTGGSMMEVDSLVNRLAGLMRNDLSSFDKR